MDIQQAIQEIEDGATEVSVCCCDIDDADVRAIANALLNSKVKVLDLWRVNITDIGIQYLADSLP